MHLLIPFASALSSSCVAATRTLELPALAKLLSRLTPTQRLGSGEYTLTPPHERALAQSWGWHGDDGLLPWAAHSAAQDGIAIGEHAWGLVTPVHWNVGREQVSLADPQALGLTDAASRALFAAIAPLFESDGYTLAYGTPLRWYAAHPSFESLPTASIDRVIGRSVDLWLGADPCAQPLRRLQSEVQMLMYTHALNDERETSSELPVNSFWLSGCGRAQPVNPATPLHVDESLRAPLMAEDWAAWTDAWRALDAGPIRDATAITLCGERYAQCFDGAPRNWWQRASASWRSVDPQAVLEAL